MSLTRSSTAVRAGRKKRSAEQDTKRDKYLKAKYGITDAEYKRLARHCGSACWICGKKPKPGKNLAVDHDHAKAKTGGVRRSVRGLLCFLCNKRLIGRRRREHAVLFTKAAEYLESDAAQHLLEEKNV